MSEHAMTWGETPSQDDKMWATIAHLSVYFVTIVGPLVVYLMFQDKSKYIKYHAVQALISQVALGAVGMVAVMFITVLSFVTCGIGGLLYFALLPLGLVPIYGAFRAYQGEWDGFPTLSQFGR